MKNLMFLLFFLLILNIMQSQENKTEGKITPAKGINVQQLIESYAPYTIKTLFSPMVNNEQECIKYLIKAGKIIDDLFWEQSCPDGLAFKNRLKKEINPIEIQDNNLNQDNSSSMQGTSQYPEIRDEILRIFRGEMEVIENDPVYHYSKINYGPYDVLNKNSRFAGIGAETRPPGGGFYPEDMTKTEFENAVKQNKDMKSQFESPYTVIIRKDGKLTPVRYSEYYRDYLFKIRELLMKASQASNCPPLKHYLLIRAEALYNDTYFPSDMAWYEVNNCDLDIIIGPIENYQDELFNYKTSYECIIMLKDKDASKEMDMFKSLIDSLTQKLPCDNKYIVKNYNLEKNDNINIVNVVYASGDCMKGTKTIAASLPNDPQVRNQKGGRNFMFKNIMEAKFNKIVVPIAEKMLDKELVNNVDSNAFTTFITLHEISHTLGRSSVYGKDTLPIKMALKERYSSMEELKADILSVYNHKILRDIDVYKDDKIAKIKATYLAGLFRSLRFGPVSAHGLANMIQFNYLSEKGAIKKNKKNLYSIDDKIFFDKVKELANKVLTIQSTGDYKAAGELIEKYGKMKDQLKSELESIGMIPVDIDITFDIE